MMLKPPISRMGGKSRLRKEIITRIPDHICYVEPFFGAGWVYFGKEPSEVEVINDIDGELVNLFKMVKCHAEEVNRVMQHEISARDIYNEYKYVDIKRLTEIQRAVRFIYVISQSFASRGKDYGYGTTKKPAQLIFDAERLMELKSRLKNTYIENLNFESILERYDRPHTFFFCDPPYYKTDGYGNKFDIEEHIILCNKLKNIKGKFLLTINDHDEIRKLYNGFKIEEVQVMYSVSKESSGRRKFNELIITNY